VADNLPITAGSGTTVHTDDVGGVHDQYIKIEDGTLDSTNKLIVNAAGEMLVKISTATATVPVSVASALDVSAATVTVKTVRSVTGTRSSVAASATDVLLLASNTARISAVIYYDSTAILYVGIGTTAVTSSNFSFKLDAGGVYEDYDFTGQIRGMWASATGNARVTEKT
jgi:hypothetical protein